MGRTANSGTEQRIMDAAEELFLEKGYILATTVKIAEMAGVTHAMLHYYFRTKEQIFLKVLDKNLQELFTSIRPVMTAGNTGIWETLKGGISTVFDYFEAHRRFPAMIYDVQRQNPELLAKYRESATVMLRGIAGHHRLRLENEMEAGRMNPVDFGQLFFNILTMTFVTFLSLPIMEDAGKGTGYNIDDFLENRKQEIIDTVYFRLYGKV